MFMFIYNYQLPSWLCVCQRPILSLMLQALGTQRQTATQKHPPSLILAMSLTFGLQMANQTHEEWNKIRGIFFLIRISTEPSNKVTGVTSMTT